MSIDDIKSTFFAECADLLSELEDGLYRITSDGADMDTVNAVFRAVHSIKGGAGAFGLDSLVSFAHIFENALDIVRNDLSTLTESSASVLSEAADKLSDIVACAQNDEPVEGVEPIQAKLAKEFHIQSSHKEAAESIDYAPVAISLGDLGAEEAPAGNSYTITFKPHFDLYLRGHDPQRIFRELRDLGTCTISCDTASVPPLDRFDPQQTHLSWTITLESECSEDDILAVFNWVEGSCEFTVTGGAAGSADGEIDIDAFFESLGAGDGGEADPETAELLEFGTPGIVDNGELAPEEAHAALDGPKDAEAAQVGAKKLDPQNARADSDSKPAKTIRVESNKVDRLINLMGELVISQSMLAEKINEAGFGTASPPSLALTELQNLTREIQSSVMSIRAQPIKPVFMRMSRIVREVCGITGKKAALSLEGEFTEVDTTVIEGLFDPLTHMIRNAVDHGIESGEKRREAGKPESGTIRLSASHNSGRIAIVVADDGAGINRPKVFEKAVEKGIIAPDAKLSDQEIDELIMAPGFSTADTISNVSGRGVGMDVVRQSIQSLGGRLSISCEPGTGTVFTLSLPLTLAILDGMLVRTAEQVLVLPIAAVLETLKPQKQDLVEIARGEMCVRLRNDLVPIVDIGHELGFSDRKTEFSSSIAVIVESANGTPFAFAVDAIEAQQQVVIKSLESNYCHVPCISAATILGNGKIALILDVDELIASGGRRQAQKDRQQLVA